MTTSRGRFLKTIFSVSAFIAIPKIAIEDKTIEFKNDFDIMRNILEMKQEAINHYEFGKYELHIPKIYEDVLYRKHTCPFFNDSYPFYSKIERIGSMERIVVCPNKDWLFFPFLWNINKSVFCIDEGGYMEWTKQNIITSLNSIDPYIILNEYKKNDIYYNACIEWESNTLYLSHREKIYTS